MYEGLAWFTFIIICLMFIHDYSKIAYNYAQSFIYDKELEKTENIIGSLIPDLDTTKPDDLLGLLSIYIIGGVGLPFLWPITLPTAIFFTVIICLRYIERLKNESIK